MFDLILLCGLVECDLMRQSQVIEDAFAVGLADIPSPDARESVLAARLDDGVISGETFDLLTVYPARVS